MSNKSTSITMARWAVLAMFFANGAVSANWLARILQIQANLAMSEGELGLVLMGMAVGVLSAPLWHPALFGTASVGRDAQCGCSVGQSILFWRDYEPDGRGDECAGC